MLPFGKSKAGFPILSWTAPSCFYTSVLAEEESLTTAGTSKNNERKLLGRLGTSFFWVEKSLERNGFGT